MNIRQIIKLPEYKKFSYKPIYYDEKKEKLEQKIKNAKNKKQAIENGTYKPDFKGKFKSKYIKGKNITKRQKQAANIRFLLLVVFFSALAYIIIQKSDVLSKMFEVLLKQ